MEKINKMSFNELKNELHNCDNNKIKEKLIRELMFIKYQRHVIQQQENNKKHQRIKNKIKHQSIPTNEIIFDSDDFDDSDSDKRIIEYNKDKTNNNLMDRMNSDMEIKQMKVSTNKKDIVKPFVNSSCDTYATFKNEPGTNIKSFKN